MIRLVFALLVFFGTCAVLASYHVGGPIALILGVVAACSLFFLTSKK